MNIKKILMDEVKQAPDTMLEEVLDFVRFLKAGRFAQASISTDTIADEEIKVIFDTPRTLSDLANEQRAFLASLSQPLVDIDLPSDGEAQWPIS